VKLQDAYVSETGLYIGSWKAIGYTMDGATPSFYYSDVQSYTDESVAIPSQAAPVWSAVSKVALNDCKAGASWTLPPLKSGTQSGLSWGAAIKQGSGTAPTDAGAAKAITASGVELESSCSVLTPQFINFRRS